MSAKAIGIILGVLVVGGGIYIATSNDGEKVVTEESSDKTISTFGELVARGEAVTCTFEHNDGTNVTEGTVYIADRAEKIRGDFTLRQGDGEPMEGHIIRDESYNYVWGSFYEQGIKTKVTEENQEQLFEDAENDATIDENTEFTCNTWNVDESKFEIPTDVEFVDFSAQMEAHMEAVGEMQGINCSACDQVPAGAPREQCLQSLGCM